MLNEQETMCCAHCGPGPDGRETSVRVICDGEEMIVLLDTGWCFQFMVIGGPRLGIQVYCPGCSLETMRPSTEPPKLPNTTIPALCTECFCPADPFLGPSDSCSHARGCSKIGNDERHETWLCATQPLVKQS